MRGVEGEMRIAVTGVGMVSPLGKNVEQSWQRLIAGESGIESVDYPPSSVTVAAHVNDFDPREDLSGLPRRVNPKRVARAAQFALKASNEALKDAGLLTEEGAIDERHVNRREMGVIFGTGMGGGLRIADVDRAVQEGKLGSGYNIMAILSGRTATTISQMHGLRGVSYAPEGECATGGISIQAGINEILVGNARKMIVGSAEGSIDARALALFESAGTLSLEPDPLQASRPFDEDRGGFVMGEGAGALILELWEDAVARGVEPYAEIIGCKSTNDGDSAHETDPTGEGAMDALVLAFRGLDGILREGRPIFVSAHATATRQGDPVEGQVLSDFFSPYGIEVFTHNPKGATGHELGASGAIEAVFLLKTLRTGTVPPNLNVTKPIPQVERLQIIRPTAVHNPDIRTGVNNAFGFGGICNVTVFEYKPAPREV